MIADEAEGYQHNFKDKDDDILSSFFLIFRSFEISLLLIVISYGLVAVSVLYLILQRQEHNRIVNQLTTSEHELQNERQRINQDIDMVENSISSQNIQQVPFHTLNRLATLREKSEQLTNSLEAIRVGTSRPLLYSFIGEFFSKWIDLEEQIQSFLVEPHLKKTIPPSMNKMLKQISKLEVFPESIINEIKSVANYRNSIIHGGKKLDKNNLESKISAITQILNDLKMVSRINQFIVSIPYGTSVPGCEERNECYIPYELKIKENQVVLWLNEDVADHTVTSGTPDEGPDGKFDSNMINSGDTFANRFPEKGTYHYFCMVHPWQVGKIIVS